MTIVNVYRQPSYDAALEALRRWPIPPRCLVAGDFNAKHPTWQTGRLEGRGEAIAAWAAENRLALLNETDVPTNPHGNTIDLAFTNVNLAEATIEDHLATSSDHFTLSICLPGMRRAPARPSRVRLTSDGEVERFVEVVEAAIDGIAADVYTPEQLDTLAADLVTILQQAAQAAGHSVHKTPTRGAPWWTDACATAASEYRSVRRMYPLGFCREVQVARRAFQRIVRREKRLYWRQLIDGFSDSKSVFKAVRWLRSPGPLQPPPLQVGGTVYETQQDKAEALRRATLERRTAADDIADPWIPVTPRARNSPDHEADY
jgi:hypothetical protein